MTTLVLLAVGAGCRSRRSPAAPRDRPSVAVFNFKNLSPSTDSDWLSTAFSEVISSELAAGGELRLISGERVARLRHEFSLLDTLPPDTLARISQTLNTGYVVAGSYQVLDQPKGQQIRLALRLQNAGNGELVASVSRIGTQAGLFDLISGVATILREKLGVNKISAVERETVRATVSSYPEAFRLYLEGLDHLRSFDAQAARDVLAEATDVDPDYALAHAVLSEAWLALGYDREAEHSARRAYELAEGLPRGLYLWIKGRHYESSAQQQRAIATYRELWRSSPDIVDYGLRLAEAQIAASRGPDALATVAELHALPPAARNDPQIDLVQASAAFVVADHQLLLAASERAVAKGQALGASILVAEARRWQGEALFQLERVAEAVVAFEEARHLFAQAGDRGKIAQVLRSIADLRLYERDHSGAEELYGQALRIHQETGNLKRVAELKNCLAYLPYIKGDLSMARAMLEEAVVDSRAVGDRHIEADSLDTLVNVLLGQGDLIAAQALAQEALEIYQEIGSREWSAWSYFNLGRIALAAGELTHARALLDEALVITDEVGKPYLAGFVLNALGEVLLAAGDLDEAQRLCEESRAARSELDGTETLAETQFTMAHLALESGRLAEAEVLARQAAKEHRLAQRVDDESLVAVVLARTLLAQGKLDEAEAVLDRVQAHAKRSQNPTVRLAFVMAAARWLATAGEYDDAIRRLETVQVEATRLGLVGLVLEGRLALGEIEIVSGGAAGRETAQGASGRARLAVLAAEAQEMGYGLIARKAAAASA